MQNYVTCWGYFYDGRNGYYGGDSYLIKPSEITGNIYLDEFEPVDFILPIGTAG